MKCSSFEGIRLYLKKTEKKEKTHADKVTDESELPSSSTATEARD